jgi:hypothetical protein
MPRTFPGKKWLMTATYVSEAARAATLREVEGARKAGYLAVGVRPASYIGEDCDALVTVTYGAGMSIWCFVTRDGGVR